jgi:hypothetical protein
MGADATASQFPTNAKLITGIRRIQFKGLKCRQKVNSISYLIHVAQFPKAAEKCFALKAGAEIQSYVH